MTEPTAIAIEPPYYAVIFASQRTAGDQDYTAMAQRMLELVETQPGFLGADSARDGDGFGITISYWRDLDSIATWKADAEHRVAQQLGRERWYADYTLRIAKVERASSWP